MFFVVLYIQKQDRDEFVLYIRVQGLFSGSLYHEQ